MTFIFGLQCPVCFDKLGMFGSLSKTMTHDYCMIALVEGFEEKTVMHITYSCTHGHMGYDLFVVIHM